MYVLATFDAECDVLCGGVQRFGAHATFVGGTVRFAVLLQAGFEISGRAADEVFVDGEAAVEMEHSEANNLAAGTGLLQYDCTRQCGKFKKYLIGPSFLVVPRDL